jgi:hypothetical protein
LRTLRSPIFIAISFRPLLSAAGDPAWSANPGGQLAWVRSSSAGNLLASTSEGLKGIDPANGTVLWTLRRLANAPEDTFKELEGSPLVALASADGKDPLLVVEPFAGRQGPDHRRRQQGRGHVAHCTRG